MRLRAGRGFFVPAGASRDCPLSARCQPAVPPQTVADPWTSGLPCAVAAVKFQLHLSLAQPARVPPIPLPSIAYRPAVDPWWRGTGHKNRSTRLALRRHAPNSSSPWPNLDAISKGDRRFTTPILHALIFGSRQYSGINCAIWPTSNSFSKVVLHPLLVPCIHSRPGAGYLHSSRHPSPLHVRVWDAQRTPCECGVPHTPTPLVMVGARRFDRRLRSSIGDIR